MSKKDKPAFRFGDKKRFLHPLVKFNYMPRTIGFLIYGIMLVLFFIDSRNLFIWLAILAQCVFWPHIAYLHGKFSQSGRNAELRNLLFEAFLVGVWMNLVSFQLWPSTVFFVGASINLLATRGIIFFRNALVFMVAGVLIAGLFNGFTFVPHSTLPVTYASIAFIVIYSSIVAFLSFQTSKKLHMNRYRTEAILNSVQNGVMVIDAKSGKIIEINSAAARMIGSIREEIIGEVCHRFEGHGKKGASPMAEKNQKMENAESVLLNMDGEEIPVLKTVVPFILQGKNCWLESFVDISERKKMEEELRRLVRAVDQSIDGIAVADMDGNIQFANSAWAGMHGYQQEEVVGKHLSIFHSKEQMDTDVIPFNNRVMNNGSNQGEVGHVRKDGTPFPTWMTSTVLRDEENRPVGLLGIARDITDRKQVEDELRVSLERVASANIDLEKQTALANEMAVKAEAANIAKSQFLANMSHEIRTPMNAVVGMAHLLSDTHLSEEQQYFVKIIQQSADSLLQIINDILDFSKIEAGKLDLEIIDFDLIRLLEETNNMLQIDARKKNLEYFCRVGPLVPRYVSGDPGRLRQVLVNLIGNAIKFTRQGKVEIQVSQVQKEEESDDRQITLLFSIMDTGIGISAEKIQTLFDAFTQVDASTTRKFGGTGLGLSIARNLIEMMGGRLDVSSEAGKGSIFTFTVVLEKGRAAAGKFSGAETIEAAGVNRTTVRDSGRPARILVAEDFPVNQEVVKGFLENFGFAVHIADNGKQAIRELEKNHYDLVLMDVQMPEMDGVEATRVIRDPDSDVLDHDIAIVALTGHAMTSDRKRYLDAGMNDYLSKPIKPDALYEVVVRNLPDGLKQKF